MNWDKTAPNHSAPKYKFFLLALRSFPSGLVLLPQLYFQIVEPSQELSVEYTFLPPKDLPANDYQVALTVFYGAADGFKSTTFFNQTITVLEKGQLIDWKLIFLYAIFIALVFAGGESAA